jgi:hypothetical protein
VKVRGGLLSALTDLLNNDNQSKDPNYRINCQDLHSPTFTPNIYSVIIPIVQTTLLDTTPHPATQQEALPPLAPALLRALLHHSPAPSASLKPHFKQLLSYLLAGLNSLSTTVVLASLTIMHDLLSLCMGVGVVVGVDPLASTHIASIIPSLKCLKPAALLQRGKWGTLGRYELSVRVASMLLEQHDIHVVKRGNNNNDDNNDTKLGYFRCNSSDNKTEPYDYKFILTSFQTVLTNLEYDASASSSSEILYILKATKTLLTHYSDIEKPFKTFFENAAKTVLEHRSDSPELRAAALAILLTPPLITLKSSRATLSTAISTYLSRSPVDTDVCRSVLLAPGNAVTGEDKCRVYARLATEDVTDDAVASLLVQVLMDGVDGDGGWEGWFVRSVLEGQSGKRKQQEQTVVGNEILRVSTVCYKNLLKYALANESQNSELLDKVLAISCAISTRGQSDADGALQILLDHISNSKAPGLPVLVAAASSKSFGTITPAQLTSIAKLCRKTPRAWEVVIAACNKLSPQLVVSFIVSLINKKFTSASAVLAARVVGAVKHRFGWAKVPGTIVTLGGYVEETPSVLWQAEYLCELSESVDRNVLSDEWIEANGAFAGKIGSAVVELLGSDGVVGDEAVEVLRRLLREKMGAVVLGKVVQSGDCQNTVLVDNVVVLLRRNAGVAKEVGEAFVEWMKKGLGADAMEVQRVELTLAEDEGDETRAAEAAFN